MTHAGTAYTNNKAEDLSAFSSFYQLDNSTLRYSVVHDEASDDKADRCSISGYYHHRKRCLASCRTITDQHGKYTCNSVSIRNK